MGNNNNNNNNNNADRPTLDKQKDKWTKNSANQT
jgi:hypothetical protein